MQTVYRMPLKDSLAQVYKQPFLSSAEKAARIIVCADGDLVMNDLNRQADRFRSASAKTSTIHFPMLNFLATCLDYCVNPAGFWKQGRRTIPCVCSILKKQKTANFLAIHQHWPAFVGYSCMWPDFSIYQEKKIQLWNHLDTFKSILFESFTNYISHIWCCTDPCAGF